MLISMYVQNYVFQNSCLYLISVVKHIKGYMLIKYIWMYVNFFVFDVVLI